eukprot:5349742-Prorocentrum_lima.AAC.1
MRPGGANARMRNGVYEGWSAAWMNAGNMNQVGGTVTSKRQSARCRSRRMVSRVDERRRPGCGHEQAPECAV